MRREDACNLTWEMVQGNAIVFRPLKSLRRARTSGKSRNVPSVVIPIRDELRDVLVQCGLGSEKRGPWVLTNFLGRKWTPSGLTTSFTKTRDRAGLVDANGRKKCLHDGRGTFVTYMRTQGFTVEEIADMVGWATADVKEIAKKYVDAERVAMSFLERLNRNASST